MKKRKPIQFQKIVDGKDGILFIAESGKQIPFVIKRIYFIDKVHEGSVRGYHAHKKLSQVIFVLRGSFTLTIYDGMSNTDNTLKEGDGFLISPFMWHSMGEFSKDCLIGVAASDCYDEKDYIRSFNEFRKLIK